MTWNYNLPPGCGRLPGEEPEEPAYWAMGEAIAKRLKRDHGGWRDRGNRSDYIASDCGKDSDLNKISTGIISVRGTETGVVVTWGWYATFCSGDELADDMAQEIVMGCGIGGSWDCDNDGDGASWTVSGEDEFTVDLEDIVNDPGTVGLRNIAHASKEVWEAFCKQREHIEQEAETCHSMLNENYKAVTKGD